MSAQKWLQAAQDWGIVDSSITDYTIAAKKLNAFYGSLLPISGHIQNNFLGENNVLDRIDQQKKAIALQGMLVDKLSELNAKGGNLQDLLNWAYSIDLSSFGDNLSPFSTQLPELQALIHDHFDTLFTYWNNSSFNPKNGDPSFPLPNPGSFTPIANASNIAILKNIQDYFLNCDNKIKQELSDPNFEANALTYAKEWGLSGTDAKGIRTQMQELEASFSRGAAIAQNEIPRLKGLPDFIKDFLVQTGMGNNSLNTVPFADQMAAVQKDLSAYSEETTESVAFQMILKEILFMNQFNMTPDDLKNWGNTILKNHPEFLTMNPAALAEFCKITGAESPQTPSEGPTLDQMSTNIQQWANSFGDQLGAPDLARDLLSEIKTLQALKPPGGAEQLESFLQSLFKTNIYYQYPGLSQEQMELLASFFQDPNFIVPTATENDQSLARLINHRIPPTPLFETVIGAMEKNGPAWTGLKAFSQSLFDKDFWKNFPGTSAEDLKVLQSNTGAVAPPKPTPPIGPTMQQVTDLIHDWEHNLPQNKAIQDFANNILEEIGRLLAETPPGSVQDLKDYIKKILFTADRTTDVYFRFPGLTQDALASFIPIFQDPNLTAPAANTNDATLAELANYKIPLPELFKTVMSEMESKGPLWTGLQSYVQEDILNANFWS